jgi:hypothetical protein
MFRLGEILMVLALFGFTSWGGYWLAQKAFDPNNFASIATPTVSAPNPNSILNSLPKTKDAAVQMFNKMTKAQQDCLASQVSPDQVAAIQRGQTPTLSLAQYVAVAKCLKP